MDLRIIHTAIRSEILSANEIRCSNGLILTPMDAAYVEQHATKSTDTEGLILTNCVNCGAVINPNVDHCEYCGTSYSLMGVKNPNKKSECLRLENKLLASKVNIAQELENTMRRYNDAIKAMGSYVQNY